MQAPIPPGTMRRAKVESRFLTAHRRPRFRGTGKTYRLTVEIVA